MQTVYALQEEFGGFFLRPELGDKGFNLLTKMKTVRGTPLDLFGYANVRRTERALIGEYRTLIEDALATLSPDTYQRAVQLAELPDMIRVLVGVDPSGSVDGDEVGIVVSGEYMENDNLDKELKG